MKEATTAPKKRANTLTMSSPTMQTAKKGNNLIIALREQRALQ
jgi:hypothetical protein